MGTIFFIVAALTVWSIAKSGSGESDSQQRLEDLRKRLRQQGSRPLDQPLRPEPEVSGELPGVTQQASDAAASERWSAWLDPVDSAASGEAVPSSAVSAPQALPSEAASESTSQESESLPLEQLRQGLGFPEPSPEPPKPLTETAITERTITERAITESALGDTVVDEPESAPATESERELDPGVRPAPEPIPALSDGAEPAEPGADLADRFERALELRASAFAARGGPAPVELSISSSLVRPMGDLLSVLVHLAGGEAKHLAAQSRGLPVFGLRLAQPEELTESRLVEALDHLERAHPTLRRGCTERLMSALSGLGHASPSWSGILERLLGERD